VADLPLGHGVVEHGTDGLLGRFLALADAPGGRILTFARRYGIPHNDQAPLKQFMPVGGAGIEGWGRFRRGNWWGTETASVRQDAALLKATLRLYRRLQTGPAFIQEDNAIRTVREFLRHSGLDRDRIRELRHPYAEQDVPRLGTRELPQWWALQRDRVLGVANWWLERGSVHPRLVVLPSSRVALRWTGGLWGGLGAQVIYTLRRESNVAICDYCDREFRLSRRPREGALTRCCPRKGCQREYRADRMRQARARKSVS
jgi:hypothetical protein